MKILVVSNLYPPAVLGGYELNCANVVGELRRRGHDARVLTSPSHVPGPPDPPHVLRELAMSAYGPGFAAGLSPGLFLHATDTSDFENVHTLRRLVAELVPDVVFLWNLHGVGGLHLIDFLTTHGVPWAIYLGDRVFEQMVNAAPLHVNSIFRGLDPKHFASGGIMAVSQHLVDEITRMSRFKFPEPPVIVHGYAITLEQQHHRAYCQGGRTRFAAAGRVSEQKGSALICDAVAILVRQGFSNFEVNLFGDGDIATFVSRVNALGLASLMRFHGGVTQRHLQEQYAEHDAFLFPTWSREPFAFAPFEAAACGCVPILTADCGCAERIVQHVHGIKIERTAAALANAMRNVITGALDLQRMGRAASEMVRSDLTLAGHVDKIMSVLNREARPWDPGRVLDQRTVLLAFIKHHLSLAFRLGHSD